MFTFVPFSESHYCIYSHAHRLYLSAQENGIFEYRKECLVQELFEVTQDVTNLHPSFRIKTHFNKYLGVDGNGKIASMDSVDFWTISKLFATRNNFSHLKFTRRYKLEDHWVEARVSFGLVGDVTNSAPPGTPGGGVVTIPGLPESPPEPSINEVTAVSKPADSEEGDGNGGSDGSGSGSGGSSSSPFTDNYIDQIAAEWQVEAQNNLHVQAGNIASNNHVNPGNNNAPPTAPGLNGETPSKSEVDSFIENAKNNINNSSISQTQKDIRKFILENASFLNELAVSIASEDEGLANDIKLYSVALTIEMLDLLSDLEPYTGATKESIKLATGVDPFALPGQEQLSDMDKVFIASWFIIPTTFKGPAKKIKRLISHLGNTRFIKSSKSVLETAYDGIIASTRKTFRRLRSVGSMFLRIRQSTKKSVEMVDGAGKSIRKNPIKTLESAKKGEWSRVFESDMMPRDLLEVGSLKNKLRKDKRIPTDWEVGPTKKHPGISFSRPGTVKADEVRIMPANPNSPWSSQHRPYATMKKNGKYYDKNGNILQDNKNDAAHIPLDEFKFIP
ncbi:MAG: hypothetical protein AB8G05_22540 [Oligoflexales bacterium]